MDFISNLIKRPISVVMNEPNATTTLPPGALNDSIVARSATPSRPESPSSLIAVAMNTSINTQLSDLLESAAQDLARIEEKNSAEAGPTFKDNDDTNDTIQKLLREINENLIQLSPLATKTKLQQGPPSVGLRATLPDTSTVDTSTATAGPASCSDSQNNSMSTGSFEANSMLNQFPVDAGLHAELIGIPGSVDDDRINLPTRKFIGLTEFDESQIPELPMALPTDLEAHLKDDMLTNIAGSGNTNKCGTDLLARKTTQSLMNEGEVEYNSDTEQFVECQSLHSDKFAEQSDLEPFCSALMSDFEEESSNTTLARGRANSFAEEPMDVDMSVTLEMQCLTQLAEPILRKVADKSSSPTDDDAAAPVMWHVKPVSDDSHSPKEASSGYVTPHETPVSELAPLEKLAQQKSAIASENMLNTSSDCKSSSVEILTLKDIRRMEAEIRANATIEMASSFGNERSLISNVSTGQTRSPTSSAFPLKTSHDGNNFPRSPNATPEKKEVPFSERPIPPTPPPLVKPSLSSSKLSPVPLADMDNIVSAAIPQKSPITPPLTTLSGLSTAASADPIATLNNTFIGSKDDLAAAKLVTGTSSKENRRTFTLASDGDTQEAASEPETFNTQSETPILEATLQSSNQQPRTFSVAQPQSENGSIDFGAAGDRPASDNKTVLTCTKLATEANAKSEVDDDNAEPMDIDQTLPLVKSVEDQVESTFFTASTISGSPILPALQKRGEHAMDQSSFPNSPLLPIHQKREAETAAKVAQVGFERAASPPLPAQIAGRCMSPPPLPTRRAESAERTVPQFVTDSPPVPAILKRRALHIDAAESTSNVTVVLEDHRLSAKEQAKSNAKDEKDVFVEKSSPQPMEETFKAPQQVTGNTLSMPPLPQSSDEEQFFDEDFQSTNNIVLNPSDFDYLLTKGNNIVQVVDRSSLLLKFDPLCGRPVPVNQVAQQTQNQQILQNFGNQQQQQQRTLSPTFEEKDQNESALFVVDASQQSLHQQQQQQQEKHTNKEHKQQLSAKTREQPGFKPPVDRTKKHAKMSVDVIDNDCNKTFENNASLHSEEKHLSYNKMDDLEKKLKNEVLKTDVEKKLKDAEQREEALIKRITDKDKTISKMNGVIEAYEKAIAELISDKEQLIQNYDRQLNEIKADRDSNYHHLTSLETTFSDLHVKYEKSKEMTLQLKTTEETLVNEKKQIMENLRLQEQRYEKMRSHAMQQLEIANKKLESLSKDHAVESTKLKALLKKEEISRASITEQLQQKTRENSELVKICDELINGQGS